MTHSTSDTLTDQTAHEATPHVGLSWLMAIGVVIASAMLLGALLWLGLPMAGLGEQTSDALVANAVVAGFGVLSLVVIAWMDRWSPMGVAYGFMGSIVIRMAGCAAVVMSSWGHDRFGESFGYWVAGLYMFYLALEVALITPRVKAIKLPTTATTGTDSGDAAGGESKTTHTGLENAR